MTTTEIIISIPIIILVFILLLKMKDTAKYSNYNDSYKASLKEKRKKNK